jgi:hypothetical protein
VPERLNWFKCDCGALTAEGREACGDGMSQVAQQGDSPTAAGQVAEGRLATAPRAMAWAGVSAKHQETRSAGAAEKAAMARHGVLLGVHDRSLAPRTAARTGSPAQ